MQRQEHLLIYSSGLNKFLQISFCSSGGVHLHHIDHVCEDITMRCVIIRQTLTFKKKINFYHGSRNQSCFSQKRLCSCTCVAYVLGLKQQTEFILRKSKRQTMKVILCIKEMSITSTKKQGQCKESSKRQNNSQTIRRKPFVQTEKVIVILAFRKLGNLTEIAQLLINSTALKSDGLFKIAKL